jgi:hypothetical protein
MMPGRREERSIITTGRPTATEVGGAFLLPVR